MPQYSQKHTQVERLATCLKVNQLLGLGSLGKRRGSRGRCESLVGRAGYDLFEHLQIN